MKGHTYCNGFFAAPQVADSTDCVRLFKRGLLRAGEERTKFMKYHDENLSVQCYNDAKRKMEGVFNDENTDIGRSGTI